MRTFFRFVGVVVAVGLFSAGCPTSSTSTVTSGTGGSVPGVCPLYGGPTNLACPSGQTLVCGFAGVATGCCPPVAPYYCSSTQSCYETATAASNVCGSDCQHCAPVNNNPTTTSSSGASSSGSTCNNGVIYSPAPDEGGACPTGQACRLPPYSCITSDGIQEGLQCCCASDGTVCVGCLQTEACGGPLGASCCPM